MKCVQSIVNAKIVRVPDDKAERMVASKSWFYVAKWKYKGNEPTHKDKSYDWQPVTAMTADLERSND